MYRYYTTAAICSGTRLGSGIANENNLICTGTGTHVVKYQYVTVREFSLKNKTKQK
jgi:hypothetical protein